MIPASMNSSKGVSTHSHFMDMEASDIVEHMKDQGAIDAQYITRLVNNTRMKAATVVLTFAGAVLPPKVQIGYEIKEL